MNRKEIGERLRIAREDCMYSRQKAASYVDVGTTTLQQWETGSREASIETIGKLAKEYGVTPQYLIFGDETEIPDITATSTAQGISVEDAIDTLKAMIDTQPKLTEEEAFLLKEFRALDDAQRRMMLRFIIGGFDSLNNSGGQGIFNSPKARIKGSFKE